MAVAVAAVLAPVMAGCGISLRTPAEPAPATTDAIVLPATPQRHDPHLPTPSPDPLRLARGKTVVSITFDDGRESDAAAAQIMSARGLDGTFFVNSATIGKPGHLTLPDLDGMAKSGHEIGGHTMTHVDLGELTGDEVRRQICDDRVNLLDWGFPARSFAYPFASATPEVHEAVRACGYNSARSLGELRTFRPAPDVDPALSCSQCEVTEMVPPPDPMYTKAPAQIRSDWRAGDLRRSVQDAMAVGGWIQLTFHGLCPSDCSPISTPENEFKGFVDWLAAEQTAGAVQVRNVGEVIGGPVRPAVAGPVAPPAVPGVNGVRNAGLEDAVGGIPSCWVEGGFGDNDREFSQSTDAHGGLTANRLVVRDYVDGDAKLLPATDLGRCAPSVMPGRTYTIGAWYKSTVPTSFSVQFRLTRGEWVYGMDSPQFAPADEYTPATWTLPPLPPGVTAISFGLALTQDGELVTDDYSMIDDSRGPS